MNLNPEMFESMKKMMNPEMMKNMTSMIQNMSDDDLRRIGGMSGQNMSPEMMRMAANQMKNMKNEDIENLKNQQTNIPNTNTNNTSNTNQAKPTVNQAPPKTEKKSSEFVPKKALTPIEKLDKIKIQGNDFYKQEKHKEAYEKYYECLNEIEFLSNNDKEKYKKEIQEIDLNCRLNITAVKLKLEDYDLVIYECNKILQIKENWKAHYRAGIAYYKKGKFKQSLTHLEKYKSLNPTNEDKTGMIKLTLVDNYIKQSKREVEQEEREVECKTNQVEYNTKEEESKVNYQPPPESNPEIRKPEEKPFKKEEPINQSSELKEKCNEESPLIEEKKGEDNSNPKKTSRKEYLKKILENEGKPKMNDDEPEIEKIDKKEEQKCCEHSKQPSYKPNNVNDSLFDEKVINEYKNKIEGMNDSEMSFMIESFKNMDNNTIKGIFSMKGQNLSDEQINLMKMQMNPNLLKMAAKSNIPNPNANLSTNPNISNNTSHNNSDCNHMNNSSTVSTTPQNENSSTSSNNKSPGFPGGMDFSSMMSFVQQNPELLKSVMGNSNMAGMFGNDNNSMMSTMNTIIWVMGFPQRIKAFFKSTKGKILIAFVIVLIIGYFYR